MCLLLFPAQGEASSLWDSLSHGERYGLAAAATTGEVAAVILTKLVMDLYVRAGPCAAFPLALLLLQVRAGRRGWEGRGRGGRAGGAATHWRPVPDFVCTLSGCRGLHPFRVQGISRPTQTAAVYLPPLPCTSRRCPATLPPRPAFASTGLCTPQQPLPHPVSTSSPPQKPLLSGDAATQARVFDFVFNLAVHGELLYDAAAEALPEDAPALADAGTQGTVCGGEVGNARRQLLTLLHAAALPCRQLPEASAECGACLDLPLPSPPPPLHPPLLPSFAHSLAVAELGVASGAAPPSNAAWKATVTSAFRATLASTLRGSTAVAAGSGNARGSLDGGRSGGSGGGHAPTRSSLDGRTLWGSADAGHPARGAAGGRTAAASPAGEWPPLLEQRPPPRSPCGRCERFQQWLRLLLFQLLEGLAAGAGGIAAAAAPEGPWVAALSCLVHLSTHSGAVPRAYVEELPPSVVAALLEQCRRHRWSEHLHAWLVTLAANLLYVHTDGSDDYGPPRSIKALSMRSDGAGSTGARAWRGCGALYWCCAAPACMRVLLLHSCAPLLSRGPVHASPVWQCSVAVLPAAACLPPRRPLCATIWHPTTQLLSTDSLS